MGSRGTGKFTDYSGMTPTGNGGNGGKGDKDPCDKEINCLLDDVGRSQYYSNYNNVPPIGTKVEVLFDGKRLVVQTMIGKEILGYLPTSYNYILLCINQGRVFNGGVADSRNSAIPYIKISVKS